MGNQNNNGGQENGSGANTGEIHKVEFPYFQEFPIECGNLLAEGSEVGVTIEVTNVQDRNFVFELRPGAYVQSYKLDVYPLPQLYNNLLNDRDVNGEVLSESWKVNERIRDYLFNESGSGGYAFSINDFDNPDDFLQIEYDWMNTSYAAASAIAIPDCGFIIAVVASTEVDITSENQEQLTLCYVHTSSQPLIGDPQCEIDVRTGYRAFGVQHYLNADAAGVYFFGGLTSEIDAYIDAFGDTMMRDYVRTLYTSPSVANDPNNPQSLYYSRSYEDAADADHTIMSTTIAVAVDANLTPQTDYVRRDFHLLEKPDDVPPVSVQITVPEHRVGATYAEFQIDMDRNTQVVRYRFYNAEDFAAIEAMADKDKRKLAREIASDGFGCTNENFKWDYDGGFATGGDFSEYVEGVLHNLGFTPGETYRMVYVARNGVGEISSLEYSEPFTMKERNFTSPDACKANVKLTLDQATRTSFRTVVEFDPATVSAIHIQYMTDTFNPGFWIDAPWDQWVNFIFFPNLYWDEKNDYAPIINTWPTVGNPELMGQIYADQFVWTGMTPDTNYTVYMCAEDFDGNISQMFFDTIRTSEVQVGPDPTVVMELLPSKNYPNDWTVTYTIDHDVEYYLYCSTDNVAALQPFLPGINSGDLNDIANSRFTYEEWSNAIYEWVRGGEDTGGGMPTEGNTSQDWKGNQVVIAACVAVGRDSYGDPVFKMNHLICKDGVAQTLEEIFNIVK